MLTSRRLSKSQIYNYKERGADFQDLLYFQKKPVSTLLSELKTDSEIGIKDL